MATTFTDQEIENFLTNPLPLDEGYSTLLAAVLSTVNGGYYSKSDQRLLHSILGRLANKLGKVQRKSNPWKLEMLSAPPTA